MDGQNEKFSPIIQYYLDKMDYDGYADFVKLYREYQKELQEYPGKYTSQSAQLNDYNRDNGTKHSLNYEKNLQRMEADFKKKAYDMAKQHGFTGPDPNQPVDKELTQQGEKFQNMIDHARQRQQQEAQPEEKPKEVESHEKKNIETLKEQQTYQQNPPKVEFKNTGQPSGTEQQDREQLRAAFLEQVKKVREKQMHHQQNKQPEI